jgi:hypothetical protein
MATIKEETPDSFKDYVALIEGLHANVTSSLWFRGCGRGNHKLIPSLYRRDGNPGKEGFEILERQLMIRFRQRSIPLHNRSLENDWDTLFFMQHYGVPTRLLDWTENPFIAFYFAATSGPFTAKKKKGQPDVHLAFKYDAAIWALNPVAWNNHALSQQGYDRGVLTPGDTALHPYKPLTKYTEIPIHPVALYGAHNSSRIVAQRGVFTIFGQNATPLETAFEKYNFPPDCLVKINLRRAVLAQMRQAILSNGITESVVFPDLDGLAREMKREFRFGY